MSHQNNEFLDIINILRQNKFENKASILSLEWEKLNSNDINLKNDAQKKIKSMCHPRWLGDLFIDGLTLKEWWDKLDRLSKIASKKLK